MENKKVLIFYKQLDEYYAEALKQLGFQPISFFKESDDIPEFRNTRLLKYQNVFRRLFFRDIQFLNRAYQKNLEKGLIKKMKQIAAKHPEIECALFFRADYYPDEVLKLARKISKTTVSYQFDGMSISQNLLKNSSLFDRIYTFDPSDLKTYKNEHFLSLTNCWFPDEKRVSDVNQDVFYVGVGTPERIENVGNLSEFTHENGISLHAVLTVAPHVKEKSEKGVSLSHSGMSYDENMRNVKQSNVLLDMKLPHHDGLSFRFFEALYYGKKIITNNPSALKYDFYHPDRIFVTDYKNFDGLKEFIEKPYVPASPQLIEKYGVRNWLKYVLDIPPFQTIELPQ